MREKIICALDSQATDIWSVLNRPEESECVALGGRSILQDGQGKMNTFVYETQINIQANTEVISLTETQCLAYSYSLECRT